MQTIFGKSVFEGIAIGKISVCKKEEQRIKRIGTKEPQAEIERFRRAKQEALMQLQELYKKAVKEAGEESAAILETHRMMMEDETYVNSVETMILSQKINAEYAVAATGDYFASMFSSMEDAYMKERAADVRDVSETILCALSGKKRSVMQRQTQETVILLADDLAPSETAQLDKEKVLSFVTVHGSVNSHTAIMARTMGIPALVGTPVPLDESVDGKMAVVDGRKGCICIEPDEETLAAYRQKKKEEIQKKELLKTLKGKENTTRDGTTVMVYANIADTKDLAAVLENDAGGIGLFRSEFLYLEKDTYPTEEEQVEAYRTAAETMAGKRVTIRTLDIGADKRADYFQLEKEENPAMGCRAIRICLTRPEIFKTQLRAVLRASVYGNIAVMYPMITSVEEVRSIKAIVEEVKAELKEQGIPFGDPEQGIMIETPAAAIISDLLAREADFFSIGTNDLTQYALAIDRQNSKLDSFYNPHHEAILRMIAMTVENAHKAGIRAGICGELAADTSLTETFLKMGVDELSVSPESILPLRKTIRETDLSNVP